MNKFNLVVPSGIRYVSDWANVGGYTLDSYGFPHIVDKKITGCGFTEYCLMNGLDVIICSPRKILLENKEDQHQGDVFYFRNELEVFVNFEKDLSEVGRSRQVVREDSSAELINKEEIKDTVRQLGIELNSYISRRHANNLPAKILVTYDSFRLVKDLLGRDLNKFHVVVDEFQSIFIDSRFKSDTEMEFLNQLSEIEKLCYVSATPMLDKYLDRMNEFKDLPYFEFDWATAEPNRVIKPNLTVCGIKSVIGSMERIVKDYREGKLIKSSYLSDSGRIVEIESREAVFYVNSVKNICDIIRRCALRVDECNVLCANTKENLTKLKAAFKKHGEDLDSIGKVPKKGEPHKMFTLCTRTVYLGADFYSTNARTFIFSDANVKSLSVDIALDLPQILGRQRLVENPWKNSATLYYRTISGINKLTKEDFDAIIAKKVETTNRLLSVVDSQEDILTKQALAAKYKVGIDAQNYSSDYVAVDVHEGKQLIPKFNKLVMMSEERAFEIQQVDYKDRFSVMSSLDSSGNVATDTTLSETIDEFFRYTTFPERMKYICENCYLLSDESFQIFLNSVPIEFKNYFLVLGSETCKSFSYQKYRLEEEYEKRVNNQGIDKSPLILENFHVGDKISLSLIKERLRRIYLSIGLKKTPKATDLLEYFEVKKIKIASHNKREDGFEILGIKSL